MKASNVLLKTLESYDDHISALLSIEDDAANYNCTLREWLSGAVETVLLKGAANKIAAINRAIDKKFPDPDAETEETEETSNMSNQVIDSKTKIYGNHDQAAMAARILEVRNPEAGLHIEFLNVSPFHNSCEVRIIAPTLAAFHAAREALELNLNDDGARQVQLKDVKKGEFVRRKLDAKTTFTRGDYDKSSKTYELCDWEDINRAVYLKGTTLVWIGFTF
jgi:hypothetical protein